MYKKEIKEMINDDLRNLVGYGYSIDKLKKSLEEEGWSIIKEDYYSQFSYSLIVAEPKDSPVFYSIRYSDYHGPNIDTVKKINSIPLEINLDTTRFINKSLEEIEYELANLEEDIKQTLKATYSNKVKLYGQLFVE